MAQYESMVFNPYDDSLTLEENKARNAVITKDIMDTLSAAVHAATAPLTISVTGKPGINADGQVLESDNEKKITINVWQPEYHSIDIPLGNWNSSTKSYTASVENIKPNSNVTLLEADSMTDAQLLALFDAELNVTLGDGTITFTCTGEVPTVNLSLVVKVE